MMSEGVERKQTASSCLSISLMIDPFSKVVKAAKAEIASLLKQGHR